MHRKNNANVREEFDRLNTILSGGANIRNLPASAAAAARREEKLKLISKLRKMDEKEWAFASKKKQTKSVWIFFLHLTVVLIHVYLLPLLHDSREKKTLKKSTLKKLSSH